MRQKSDCNEIWSLLNCYASNIYAPTLDSITYKALVSTYPLYGGISSRKFCIETLECDSNDGRLRCCCGNEGEQ